MFCENSIIPYLLFLQHQQILRGGGQNSYHSHWPALQVEMTQPEDIQYNCCWSGLASNAPRLHFIKSRLWCYSHLLNLRVEDLPGAFLKPVHVHCTGRRGKERRSGGNSDEKKKGCWGLIKRQIAKGLHRQMNESWYRGFLILLVLALVFFLLSGNAAQPEEFIISNLLFHSSHYTLLLVTHDICFTV